MTEAVVIAVFAMRLAVPLLILRFPLPGIAAAMAADMLDGALFSGLTGAPLEGYQNFDKALDTYYLAMAYHAMVRNWSDPTAIRIGRALFYYRLVGVAVFSVSDQRAWLLLFAATFELYFIFYEVVRVRWRAERLGRGHLLTVAALAWVAIKLPQEYWIHVAGGSTTEWLKVNAFGVAPDDTRMEAIANRPLVAIAAMVAAVGLLALGRASLAWLPPADHRPVFDADRYPWRGPGEEAGRTVAQPWGLTEKIVMISLIGLAFSEFLPGIAAGPAQLVLTVTAAVLIGAGLSAWTGRRPGTELSAAGEFIALCLLSLPAVEVISRGVGAGIEPLVALFYVLLFTLLITVHDRALEGAPSRVRVPLESGRQP